jgi:heat shock protein HslJ
MRRVVVAVVLLLAACGGTTRSGQESAIPWVAPPASAIAASSPSTADLDGRTFVVQSLVVDGTARVPVAGTSLGFQAGQLDAATGCNHASGAYRVSDGHLVVDGLSATEMGCDDAGSAQERTVLGLLQARPALSLDGQRLHLASEAAEIDALDREVADPDRKLLGTTWHYAGLFDPASASRGQLQATLTFDERTFTITACRTVSGTFAALPDGSVLLPALPPVGTPCAEPHEEDRLFSTLQGTLAVTVDARSLTLKRADGYGVTFSA